MNKQITREVESISHPVITRKIKEPNTAKMNDMDIVRNLRFWQFQLSDVTDRESIYEDIPISSIEIEAMNRLQVDDLVELSLQFDEDGINSDHLMEYVSWVKKGLEDGRWSTVETGRVDDDRTISSIGTQIERGQTPTNYRSLETGLYSMIDGIRTQLSQIQDQFNVTYVGAGNHRKKRIRRQQVQRLLEGRLGDNREEIVNSLGYAGSPRTNDSFAAAAIQNMISAVRSVNGPVKYISQLNAALSILGHSDSIDQYEDMPFTVDLHSIHDVATELNDRIGRFAPLPGGSFANINGNLRTRVTVLIKELWAYVTQADTLAGMGVNKANNIKNFMVGASHLSEPQFLFHSYVKTDTGKMVRSKTRKPPCYYPSCSINPCDAFTDGDPLVSYYTSLITDPLCLSNVMDVCRSYYTGKGDMFSTFIRQNAVVSQRNFRTKFLGSEPRINDELMHEFFSDFCGLGSLDKVESSRIAARLVGIYPSGWQSAICEKIVLSPGEKSPFGVALEDENGSRYYLQPEFDFEPVNLNSGAGFPFGNALKKDVLHSEDGGLGPVDNLVDMVYQTVITYLNDLSNRSFNSTPFVGNERELLDPMLDDLNEHLLFKFPYLQYVQLKNKQEVYAWKAPLTGEIDDEGESLDVKNNLQQEKTRSIYNGSWVATKSAQFLYSMIKKDRKPSFEPTGFTEVTVPTVSKDFVLWSEMEEDGDIDELKSHVLKMPSNVNERLAVSQGKRLAPTGVSSRLEKIQKVQPINLCHGCEVGGNFDKLWRRIQCICPYNEFPDFTICIYSDNLYMTGVLRDDAFLSGGVLSMRELGSDDSVDYKSDIIFATGEVIGKDETARLKKGTRVLISLDGAKMEAATSEREVWKLSELCLEYHGVNFEEHPDVFSYILAASRKAMSGGIGFIGSTGIHLNQSCSGHPLTVDVNNFKTYWSSVNYLEDADYTVDPIRMIRAASKAGVQLTVERIVVLPDKHKNLPDRGFVLNADILGNGVMLSDCVSILPDGSEHQVVIPVLEYDRAIKALCFMKSSFDDSNRAAKCLSLLYKNCWVYDDLKEVLFGYICKHNDFALNFEENEDTAILSYTDKTRLNKLLTQVRENYKRNRGQFVSELREYIVKASQAVYLDPVTLRLDGNSGFTVLELGEMLGNDSAVEMARQINENDFTSTTISQPNISKLIKNSRTKTNADVFVRLACDYVLHVDLNANGKWNCKFKLNSSDEIAQLIYSDQDNIRITVLAKRYNMSKLKSLMKVTLRNNVSEDPQKWLFSFMDRFESAVTARMKSLQEKHQRSEVLESERKLIISKAMNVETYEVTPIKQIVEFSNLASNNRAMRIKVMTDYGYEFDPDNVNASFIQFRKERKEIEREAREIMIRKARKSRGITEYDGLDQKARKQLTSERHNAKIVLAQRQYVERHVLVSAISFKDPLMDRYRLYSEILSAYTDNEIFGMMNDAGELLSRSIKKAVIHKDYKKMMLNVLKHANHKSNKNMWIHLRNLRIPHDTDMAFSQGNDHPGNNLLRFESLQGAEFTDTYTAIGEITNRFIFLKLVPAAPWPTSLLILGSDETINESQQATKLLNYTDRSRVEKAIAGSLTKKFQSDHSFNTELNGMDENSLKAHIGMLRQFIYVCIIPILRERGNVHTFPVITGSEEDYSHERNIVQPDNGLKDMSNLVDPVMFYLVFLHRLSKIS